MLCSKISHTKAKNETSLLRYFRGRTKHQGAAYKDKLSVKFEKKVMPLVATTEDTYNLQTL